MTKSVAEIYHDMAIEEIVKKVNKKEISSFIKTNYNDCKKQLDDTISELEFAAYFSNFNPNRAGIGEKAQLRYLKENKFPTIDKLPPNGKNSIKITELGNNQLGIVKQKEPSNLDGTKNFDAIAITNDGINFFILKTVDLSPASDNIGGGHQTNVKDELIKLIEHLSKQNFSFDNKPCKFYIIIDGRSAPTIIAALQKKAGINTTNIIISESENL